MSQEPSILAEGNIRQHPRIRISGHVAWSSGRKEGWCDLLTLSSSGVGISLPREIRPTEGTRFLLTLIINQLQFEEIEAETAGVGADLLSLRFVSPADKLQSRIASLIDSIGSFGLALST